MHQEGCREPPWLVTVSFQEEIRNGVRYVGAISCTYNYLLRPVGTFVF